MGYHLYSAVPTIGAGIGGLVSNAVLVADIVRYFLGDLVHFFDVLRKESYAAGLQRQRFQGALGGALPVFRTEDADGINRWAVFVLDGAHGLLQGFAAFIVIAVGDHQ